MTAAPLDLDFVTPKLSIYVSASHFLWDLCDMTTTQVQQYVSSLSETTKVTWEGGVEDGSEKSHGTGRLGDQVIITTTVHTVGEDSVKENPTKSIRKSQSTTNCDQRSFAKSTSSDSLGSKFPSYPLSHMTLCA